MSQAKKQKYQMVPENSERIQGNNTPQSLLYKFELETLLRTGKVTVDLSAKRFVKDGIVMTEVENMCSCDELTQKVRRFRFGPRCGTCKMKLPNPKLIEVNGSNFIPGTSVHVTVTPRNEYSRIMSVKRVSESEWEYEVSGDHGDMEWFTENKFDFRMENFETGTVHYSVFSESERVAFFSPTARKLSYETEETALNIGTYNIRSFTSSELGLVHMLAGRKSTMVFMKPRVDGQSETDWINEKDNKTLTLHFKSPNENALAFCMLSNTRLGKESCFGSLDYDHIHMICGFLMN